jgi:N utilization substance protein B
MISARRRSREFATQGLYQWLLTGTGSGEIEQQMTEAHGFDKADREHFETLLCGVIRESADLTEKLAPCLDRPIGELSPVERAILLIGTYELTRHIEIPYRVVINEAVELAKTFGGQDGFRYVNGVLDKVAAKVRSTEAQHARGPAPE